MKWYIAPARVYSESRPVFARDDGQPMGRDLRKRPDPSGGGYLYDCLDETGKRVSVTMVDVEQSARREPDPCVAGCTAHAYAVTAKTVLVGLADTVEPPATWRAVSATGARDYFLSVKGRAPTPQEIS